MIVDAVPGAYVTSLMIGKNEAEDEKNGKLEIMEWHQRVAWLD